MIVPHVAIVSSLLLASNNPSTFEGITTPYASAEFQPPGSSTSERDSAVNSEVENQHDVTWKIPEWKHLVTGPFLARCRSLAMAPFHPTYCSKYKPVSMWNRGQSKASWMAKFVDDYGNFDSIERNVLDMGVGGWVLSLCAPALVLMLVPPFLGGMVRY